MAIIDKLTAIADAVREKADIRETMTLDRIAMEIAALKVGGGGGGGETVTIATSCTNAKACYDLLTSLKDADATVHVWVFNGDASTTGVDNQAKLLVICDFVPNSFYWVRCRGGVYNANLGNTAAYDLVMSAGDSFVYWGSSV
jgi:hypothetical protein